MVRADKVPNTAEQLRVGPRHAVIEDERVPSALDRDGMGWDGLGQAMLDARFELAWIV